MGFRITTWNVNGIRNPFSYEPWRGKRTFEAMFDILEADIVVFQETKIQRKDLRDDMVLVPGWDCYFSLPRVKKGYSGVVIYTRNSTCAPIRAEEGLSGMLCPPNSSVPFRELPENQQIGGYPTIEQLSQFDVDVATLDSEGRCVILEFPAFVLLGIYSPANRDESRDSFRRNFIDLMDARIRNLVAMGKRVFVTGDLNISRGEIDAAHAGEAIRKGTLTEDEFVSTHARRVFNQLLSDGKVIGEREEGREQPVLHDICRSFHPDRKGMYTCWEQRINARPGNYGSRIDYVLCSLDMQDWFCDSNIQEGLMGSDHCPVYATFKETVHLGGTQLNIRDIMNPPGMFENGERRQEYTAKCLLPTSGRLIPEFDKRRSIKDMFTRRPNNAPQSSPTSTPTLSRAGSDHGESKAVIEKLPTEAVANHAIPKNDPQPKGIVRKRSEKGDSPVKRSKSVAGLAPTPAVAGQRTLKGFFKPKSSPATQSRDEPTTDHEICAMPQLASPSKMISSAESQAIDKEQAAATVTTDSTKETNPPVSSTSDTPTDDDTFVDPIASKEDWSKLFTKKRAPLCESHQEPCISLTTKKPGVNCGRSFWICPRPLGPSGNKEKGTQWRCPTFIWASDRNSSMS
ncbi:DNA-(apurinic or apyrimidinic site) lyase APN2 [Aspergillus vadensis CBS 113365]|uniref:DNA-(apurinic or apyrimidinic site) endonuclease 2 n=1 Tax=Aspergillus vadensis (strain CBS 113365 / IMI 142717 / IBT 24658) TaxID=1448311 RepID=A0A319C4Y1_ASPVC|nr:DNA lyase Apn2 [Aspergillus vadensis CBS 113365]PYH63842.1 DNA lyase Apn2 [Aspergillus vadensis CBS 113365]